MMYVSKATELFSMKFHCSQAVFAAFAPSLGLDETSALKIGGCFGSGLRQGEVCGACTGALMALGLKYGQATVEDWDSRLATNRVTDQFVEAFRRENGSIICRELLGLNISTPEGLACAREKELFTTFCPKMVASATKIAQELLCLRDEEQR